MALMLGIDTSCDETSLALLDGNGKVLVNLVSSQAELHAVHGGVVPELASRCHMENLPPLLNEALQQVGKSLEDLTGIAVTNTPGLIGCLLIGVSFAKALAYRLKIPLYAVNHLEGHLFSPFIEREILFPFLGLVVSGGHTAFYRVNSDEDVTLIGQTVDDAAGEAFDKTAKMLNLGYPGGPAIDRLAQQGRPRGFEFGVPKVKMGQQYLSFSGLKTALWQRLQKTPATQSEIPDLCAAIQEAIVAILADKTDYFLRQEPVVAFGLSGGVAMNSQLRKALAEVCKGHGCHFIAAKPEYCTDNAAMIAAVALSRGVVADPFELNALASRKIQARQLARDMHK